MVRLRSWALLSVVGAIAVVAARRRGHGLGLDVAGPRVLAAGLFVALLLTTAPRDPKLLLHTALVAVPYLLATSFRVRAAPSCTPRTS